jgi:hypothetical protein
MPFTGLERWGAYPEQTVVTSNPAAGVVSVDVKTFTGRGRVSYLDCICVADANIATRNLRVYKVHGGSNMYIATGTTFTATQTSSIITARGFTATQGAANPALADVDFAPGDILRVLVGAGQAGDDIGAITCSFKEML